MRGEGVREEKEGREGREAQWRRRQRLGREVGGKEEQRGRKREAEEMK